VPGRELPRMGHLLFENLGPGGSSVR